MFARGVTLIEVLIACFILSTAALGMLALQASALGILIVSSHRQQASLLLVELSELVLISPAAFREVDLPAAISEDELVMETCNDGQVCASAAFVALELESWTQTVRNRLPEAQIDIQRKIEADRVIWSVTLEWHGPQGLENTMQAEWML